MTLQIKRPADNPFFCPSGLFAPETDTDQELREIKISVARFPLQASNISSTLEACLP